MKRTLSNSGFTLVETLVALFVISVGIVGAFALITFNFSNATLIKNNLIASGLAQEGIEVTRHIRDSGWHSGRTMAAALPDGTYRVQWNSLTFIPLGPGVPLNKNAGGAYQYGAGEATPFTRTITIETVSPVEKKVTVNVDWVEKTGTKNINAETHFFDWL